MRSRTAGNSGVVFGFILTYFLIIGVAAAEERRNSIEVELAFASNFIDRGEDVFRERARQKGRHAGESSGEWVFQPALVWHTPVDGLTTSLSLSLAVRGRDDRDLDGYLQHGPDQTNLMNNADALSGVNPDLAFAASSDCASGCPPGYYKEAVGLAREDRVIHAVVYERETSAGLFGFGIHLDAFANPRVKEPAAVELAFKYAPPKLSQLSLEVYTSASDSEQYYMLAWADEISLNENMSVEYAVSIGYGVVDSVTGTRDVTLNARYNIHGFFAGVIVSHRPNLSFFDEDEDAPLKSANWLIGGSSRGDGLVHDHARISGYANQILNEEIQGFLRGTSGREDFDYTPRRKLPRVVWAIQLGYAFSTN